ncbi:hypothetical protein B481_1331 [Planococcus halocryophilus Or1]|nr:hypothetical protein B481_1331 [Planococcus halocryophilus Or1]
MKKMNVTKTANKTMIRKKMMTLTIAGAMVLSASPFMSPAVGAVGNGPAYGGNETINTSILTTYDEMADFLQTQEAKQKIWNLK